MLPNSWVKVYDPAGHDERPLVWATCVNHWVSLNLQAHKYSRASVLHLMSVVLSYPIGKMYPVQDTTSTKEMAAHLLYRLTLGTPGSVQNGESEAQAVDGTIIRRKIMKIVAGC